MAPGKCRSHPQQLIHIAARPDCALHHVAQRPPSNKGTKARRAPIPQGIGSCRRIYRAQFTPNPDSLHMDLEIGKNVPGNRPRFGLGVMNLLGLVSQVVGIETAVSG